MTKCLVVLIAAGVWMSLAALSWKDNASQDAENAIKLYNENKLDEALAKITAAQVGMPNSPKLQYNMGNVLYKKGQFEDARAGYKTASLDAPKSLAQSATYNMGNASLKAGDIKGAIDAYTEALLLDPDDAEARYNLELALHAQQQKQKQDKKQQDKDKKDKQDQKDQSQQKGEQQKGEQQKQQESKQAQRKENEQAREKPQKPQQLTKDQIQQILAALKQQEQQVERKLHQPKSSSYSVEKNW